MRNDNINIWFCWKTLLTLVHSHTEEQHCPWWPGRGGQRSEEGTTAEKHQPVGETGPRLVRLKQRRFPSQTQLIDEHQQSETGSGWRLVCYHLKNRLKENFALMMRTKAVT